LSEIQIKRGIVLLGKFLYERGFLVATDGNISARGVKAGIVLITPKGRCKGELKIREISKIGLNGKVISGEPSSEWRLHLAVYRARSDVGAIVHAHPLFTTLISLQKKGRLMDLPEAETLGEIRFIPYFPPGSKELAWAVTKALAKNPGCDIFILKRHGVIVLGKELKYARFKLERLEFFSFLYFLNLLRTDKEGGL